MRIGIATDHGGFVLKEDLLVRLKKAGHEGSWCASRFDPGPLLGSTRSRR